MSEVIRDAIIRLRLEMQRGKLEAGDVAAVARKYTELHQAAKESQQAVHDNIGAARQYASAAREANSAATGWAAGLKKLNAEWRQQGSGRNSWGEGMQRMQTQASAGKFKEIQLSERLAAVRRRNAEEERAALESAQASAEKAARAHQAFGIHAARAFKDGLEGSIQLARGIALMSASGEEDTRKLLEQFAKIEAATALIRGAINLSKFARAFGPVGVAVAGVTAVLAAGVIWWKKWKEDGEAAIRDVGQSAARESERLLLLKKAQQELNASMADLRAGAGITSAEVENRRERERQRLVNENADLVRQAAGDTGLRSVFADALRQYTRPDLDEASRNRIPGGMLFDARRMPSQAREQLTLETQLRDSLRRRVDFEKDFAEQQANALQASSALQRTGVGIAATSPFGLSPLAAPAFGVVSDATERRSQQAISKLQNSLDAIVDAFEDAAKRVEVMSGVIKQLDQSAPK